ncbi:MAG: TolC family outer membrane protein [Arenimonas sp.]|jgi:outer membrane protein
MSIRLRPLTFALLIAGVSAQASATDLIQAYDLARQSDPQFAASEAQKQAQEAGIGISRGALLPQITADVNYNRSFTSSSGNQVFAGTPTPLNSTYSESSNRNSGVNLRQSLYDHSNYTRLGASKARSRQADAEYDAAADALIVRVADAYFNVLTAIETLSASRAEERSVKRQLDQAEKRLEVGLAPITDVHEARARYDSARANAILQATALDDAYEALAEITGQPLSNLKGLSADFRPLNPDTRTIEEWVTIALESNPTLKAYVEALAAAQKDVGTARAAHYPTLSATASYGDDARWGDSTLRTSPTSLSQFGSASTGPSYGVTLTVPVFSGFATRSRVRQALYQRDAAADRLEQQKRSITRTTRGAYRNLIAGLAEVEARRLAVVSAQAAYEAGEAGLEVGTRTIVDVLIAQQQLFQAQREYARARHAYLVNLLRLRQAAGILEASDLELVNRFLVAEADASLERVDRE